MSADADLFAPGFREQPYWWEAAPRPRAPEQALPARADVVIIGSGFTGLNAALTLARAGRQVVVLDAEDPGFGASSRNAGYVGRSLKHTFGEIKDALGLEQARAVYRDLRAAFDHVLTVVGREGIACHLTQYGRFQAALSARHYEALARDSDLKRRHLGEETDMLSRTEVRREVGSDLYVGGRLIADHRGLHPGLYQLGLLDRSIEAGTQVHGRTQATGLRRDADGFTVATPRGAIAARDVLVATNGYTDASLPWFRRRIIPFHGFMVATEPLSPERIARILPNRRLFHDYINNLNYMRLSPDGSRLLFGGRTGAATTDLKGKARRLHAIFSRIVPDLAAVRLGHAWSGQCAGSFDLYPHIGVADGVHYALAYCFAGLPMGSWLGHKAALRILGAADAGTSLDSLPLETRFWHRGEPWFVPLAAAYFDWRDWYER